MDTQHIADVGDKIISGPGAKVEDLKPSIDLIRRGQAALEQLRANRTFDNWADVTQALATLQLMAMREAGTNSPQGPRYRAAIASKLRLYGFHELHKATRCFLVKQLAPHLAEVIAWRLQLPEEKRFALNDPLTVLSSWKRFLRKQRDKAAEADNAAPTGDEEKMRPFEEWGADDWMVALDEISISQLVEILPWTRILDALGAEGLLKAMSFHLRNRLETQFTRQLKAAAASKKLQKPARKAKLKVVAGREHSPAPMPEPQPEKMVALDPAPEPATERTYLGRRILDGNTTNH